MQRQQQQLFRLVCQHTLKQQHNGSQFPQQAFSALTTQRNFAKWFNSNSNSNSNNKTNNNTLFKQQQQNYSNQPTTLDVELSSTTATSAAATTSSSAKPMMSEAQVEEFYMQGHIPLSHSALRTNGPPYTDVSYLNNLETARHLEPKDAVDKVAYGIMRFLRVFVHAFFRDRYVHHAVVLETVAAVPGMVAGCLRHFTSLRTMSRDHGWIGSLVEEAENERMHLLTWMQVVKPTLIQRLFVIAAQIAYTTFYTMSYVISPRFSHRMVGYLEEEAVSAYTQFLQAIDSGAIPNTPAPEIAIKYWNLSPEASLRDVVLAVRADECMHRDYNHTLATKSKQGLH